MRDGVFAFESVEEAVEEDKAQEDPERGDKVSWSLAYMIICQ
jgi:hypothetical protein